MGLMDRDYMHRTPEERTQSVEEAKKHRERLNEMGRLFAKGESMTAKDKARLEQIYEENRAYLSGSSISSSTQNLKKYKDNGLNRQKQKSSLVPVLIFTIILLLIVLIFTYFPQFANFTLY